jgi:replication factor C subunit 2/4
MTESNISVRNKIPWVDKYRPTKLNDIVYHHEVIKMLKSTLKTGNLPHLLFYGPPGVGKTSTILAMSYELFGPKLVKDRILELNASDERGISVVRNKILAFSKVSIGNPDKNYPCPAFKIIILDEADAMTSEAQSALRKMIENTSSITRFCFICNYINQIIDPITSRCVKFKFKSIDDLSITKKIESVAIKEKMNINKDTLSAIATVSKGDMRKGIMFLHNLNYIHKYIHRDLTTNDVYKMASFIPKNTLCNIWNICTKKKENINDINDIIQIVNQFKALCIPVQNLLEQLNEFIIDIKNITDKQKSEISLNISKTERYITEGASEYLQLLNIFINIRHIIYFT